MTVSIEKLLKMAQQIQANMAYTDDQAVVAARVADHLQRFWDPRMLEAIRHYHQEHRDEMAPELVAALDVLNSNGSK